MKKGHVYVVYILQKTFPAFHLFEDVYSYHNCLYTVFFRVLLLCLITWRGYIHIHLLFHESSSNCYKLNIIAWNMNICALYKTYHPLGWLSLYGALLSTYCNRIYWTQERSLLYQICSSDRILSDLDSRQVHPISFKNLNTSSLP